MNYIDIILIIPIAYGFIQGIRKGLVKEISSILAIIVGIYIARYFSLPVSDFISDISQWDKSICVPLAYALLFILVVLFIHGIAWMVSKLLGVIMLGWLNRISGAIFGIFKMVLLLSVLLNILNVLNEFIPLKEKEAVKSSILYDPIEKTMEKVIPFLKFDDFKNLVHNGIVEPIEETVKDIKDII